MLAAGHETTAVALFWRSISSRICRRRSVAIAAEAGALDLGPAGAGNALSRLPYTRAVDRRGAAVVSAGFFDHPPGARPRQRRRARDPAPRRRADRAVGAAPPQKLVARPRSVCAGTVSAGRRAAERFSYLPFGAGPRACIGAQFALTEAVLVLARLAREFEIELADPRPVLPLALITLQPDHSPFSG